MYVHRDIRRGGGHLYAIITEGAKPQNFKLPKNKNNFIKILEYNYYLSDSMLIDPSLL